MDTTELVWKGVGYGGQLCFGLRFLVQWLMSERERRTVVPPAFWYLSMLGSVAMIAYGIWKWDDVIIVGQLSGFVVYTRNLMIARRAAPVKK